jgi:hypothetical protein
MKVKGYISSNIVIAIDAMLLIAVYLLQYYSSRKMGLMRFLVYEKMKLQEGWFRPDLIKLYICILIAGIAICAIIAIHNAIKAKGLRRIRVAAFAAILNCITYFVLINEKAQSLKSYYFILIALFIMLLLQYILLTYAMLVEPRGKSN